MAVFSDLQMLEWAWQELERNLRCVYGYGSCKLNLNILAVLDPKSESLNIPEIESYNRRTWPDRQGYRI